MHMLHAYMGVCVIVGMLAMEVWEIPRKTFSANPHLSPGLVFETGSCYCLWLHKEG